MSQHPDLAKLARDMRGGSPLRGSFLLLVILSCFSAAVLWANFTELDDVTRVDGRIVPSADIQMIEATEPAFCNRCMSAKVRWSKRGWC